MKRFTPYLFAAFCNHYLMLTLLFYVAWSPLFGGRESTIYIVWFLAAPLVSMAVAVLVVSMALRITPPLATLITGGRVSAPDGRKDPLAGRRRQGAAVGLWMLFAGSYESVASGISTVLRTMLDASRRLLLGRR